MDDDVEAVVVWSKVKRVAKKKDNTLSSSGSSRRLLPSLLSPADMCVCVAPTCFEMTMTITAPPAITGDAEGNRSKEGGWKVEEVMFARHGVRAGCEEGRGAVLVERRMNKYWRRDRARESKVAFLVELGDRGLWIRWRIRTGKQEEKEEGGV